MNIADAMMKLSPPSSGGRWTCGDTYESLVMLDESPKPTMEQLDAAWLQVLADREAAVQTEATHQTLKQQAKALLPKLDDGTATAAEVRKAVAALIRVLFKNGTIGLLMLGIAFAAPQDNLTLGSVDEYAGIGESRDAEQIRLCKELVDQARLEGGTVKISTWFYYGKRQWYAQRLIENRLKAKVWQGPNPPMGYHTAQRTWQIVTFARP